MEACLRRGATPPMGLGNLPHVVALGLIAFALSACSSDVGTAPDMAVTADRWLAVTYEGPFLVGGGDCPAVSECSTQLVGGQEECVCELEGINVETAGGYPPPPPPAWPEFPGYTWPDPEDVGGGGFPPPPPGGWSCDPNGFTGNCNWRATLRCPSAIPRGSYGTCTFSIEPAEALDYISGWTFQGNNVTRSVSSTAYSWSGVLVESGTVRVDFRAGGADAMVVTTLGVSPRSSGIWTQAYWHGRLEFLQGQGSQNCQLTSRPILAVGERLGWTGSLAEAANCVGQRIEPASTSGAVLATGSGPNEGAWYVQSASYFFKSTSQLHAGLFPAAPSYTLTDAGEAAKCRTALGLPSGSPVSVNLYTYNGTCELVPGWR